MSGDIVPFITLDFPREVLEISADSVNGGRYMVRNWGELERYWKGKNGSGNVYFTTYGYRTTQAPKHHRVEYNSAIIRHFVMDFDCKDFRKKGEEVEFEYTQEQVKRLHKHLMLNKYRHFIWFSGGGFHIWIPFAETYLPTDADSNRRIKQAGKDLMLKWHKELNLPSNDPVVAFNTRGMIRIPNSYNAKRGCWTIPLSSKELLNLTHEDLIELAQMPRSGYIELGKKSIELKVPEKKSSPFKQRLSQVGELPTISVGKVIILPCIGQAALGEGNPIHRARYHLASYLADRLRWFLPPERISEEEKKKHVGYIVGVCAEQGWVDYNESITRTQVESIVFGGDSSRGYSHANCRTLIQEGFCTGICRYYDNTAEGLI